MWKKYVTLILLCSGVFALTGCAKVQELSDEETRLIAEYAAGLLLQYDMNYVDRIAEVSEEEEGEGEELSAPPAEKEEQKSQEETESVQPERGQQAEVSETVTGTESDIAKIAGQEGASITYKDYLITGSYPEADEKEAVYLEAAEGCQLLVVRFNVAALTEEPVDISLLDKEIEYGLSCNGGAAVKPMLTILMEDLTTLDVTVNPNEEREAALVFQIPDDMKDALEAIELQIQYDGVRHSISIL